MKRPAVAPWAVRFLAAAALGWAPIAAESGPQANEWKLLDSADDPAAWRREGNAPIATEKTEGRRPGDGAIRFKVEAKNTFVIAFRLFQPDKSWGQFSGIRLWVKGDGSKEHGCLRLQCGSYEKAYVATFPLADVAWHEVTVAWPDFVPAGARVPPLGSADGFRPSDVNLVALGKSWNFNTRHESPAITFELDDISLVKDAKPSRRRVSLDKSPRVADVVKRMKAGNPVVVLALGDSITWGTSAGGNANAYPARLGALLRGRYGGDGISVLNCAIGGSTTSKGRQWMMRDVAGKKADLITVMFGYNEMCTKPEEREAATKAFADNLVAYVEEVAALMEKPPAVVFIATIPGREKHWETLDCFAEGVRGLAARFPNVTVADAAGRFKAMGREAYSKLMADEAHPSAEGQREIARIVFEAITGEKPTE